MDEILLSIGELAGICNVTGEPIEIYHVSEIHTGNNDNYCTEVQILIEKND